jgi:hypothetical protein
VKTDLVEPISFWYVFEKISYLGRDSIFPRNIFFEKLEWIFIECGRVSLLIRRVFSKIFPRCFTEGKPPESGW